MTLRVDRQSIAKAMRDAARKAKYGTREEQSGRFITVKKDGANARPQTTTVAQSKR